MDDQSVVTEWKWTDRKGSQWTVRRRESAPGVGAGWVVRRVGYAFVVLSEDETEPTDEELGRYLERHMGVREDGPPTARLWTDERSGIEWEVTAKEKEVVFRNGTEVVRGSRERTDTLPRSMSDDELREALDEALS